MTLSITVERARWRCNKRGCNQTIDMRKGTWLENSNIQLHVLIYFIYSWTMGYTTTKFCVAEFGLSHQTITDYKNFFR
ncbi:hypothetical protein, partial [Klebsiella pneumoniae]|uniref:hypothetical protein n=1 Tax=Klebsiella pneumoniae TaxID=573 RepID=UPI00405558EB